MKTKNNYKKAALIGLAYGLVISGLAVSAIAGKIMLDRYRFNKWAGDMDSCRRLCLAGKEIPAGSGYVAIGTARKSPRNIPLYTDGLNTCCGLAIDNENSGEHYLAHFTSVDDRDRVISSITNNFNLSELELELELTIITGAHTNSEASRNVYSAVKSLKLLKKTKRIQNEKVLIKNGRVYAPL